MEFKDIIKDIKYKHSNVADRLSTDLIYIREELKTNEKKTIDNFLNSFYNSRIGIRILIGQFISNCEENDGLFKPCYPYSILKTAIEDIQLIAEDIFDSSFNICVHGCNKNSIDNPKNIISDYNFLYIPSFVYYIFFEILKNSVAATYHNNKNNIDVYMSEGIDDVIVKISDTGGGMKKDELPKIFSYCYSNKKKTDILHSLKMNRFVLSGYGHGLPLSKLYAQYFGGDIQMITFNGIGTDTIIYLNKLLDNQEKKI